MVIPTGFEPILPPWKGDVLTIRRWDRIMTDTLYTDKNILGQDFFLEFFIFINTTIDLFIFSYIIIVDLVIKCRSCNEKKQEL